MNIGPDDEDDILSCVSFLLADVVHARRLIGADLQALVSGARSLRRVMGFFSDFFNRTGRVGRGQANHGMGAIEDATFEAPSARRWST